MVTRQAEQAPIVGTPLLNPARVDFVTLRLFCAVAAAGSITRGAATNNLALSAASRRLSDFEAGLGASLLTRSAQGVSLTPAGEVALRHARNLCNGFDRLGRELADWSRGIRGQVRLWANMSALSGLMPATLASFMGNHPDIRVEVEEHLSGDIAQALSDGTIDIGVFAARTPAAGLSPKAFVQDRLVLLCPADHCLARRRSIAFHDCLDFDFVGLNAGSSLLSLIQEAALASNKALRLRVQVRSFSAMTEMIAAGLGVGILPERVGKSYQTPGTKAVRLTDSWALRELCLASRVDQPLSGATQLLVDHLMAGK